MIEIKNLVKYYGDKKAVDNVSFTVEQGEVLGFLGPNGAGKSTTMNILTGFLSATSGTVKINGHDILEEPEEARSHIGYLPELPPLYMDMTVLEYLRFVADLKNIPMDQRDQQLARIMALVRITDVRKRLIRNLSKGYKQRVGIAQALVGEPEIIILDEPTVGLDPKQIKEIRSTIKNLGKKHTVILSSHILSEVAATCDRVIIINDGKLVASGPADSLGEAVDGVSRVEVSVKTDSDRAMAILKSIEGVEQVLFLRRQGQAAVYEYQTTENVDVREEVFYRMAESRIPIIGMKTLNPTLEDIFLKVTSQGYHDHAAILNSEKSEA